MVTTSSMATRSSLELMLDKLQQLEEQPKGNPPALPARPVSRARARLPRPRPLLQLDLDGRNNSQENGPSFGFQRRRTKKEEIAASAEIQESGNWKEMAEKGICKIQKWYRGHQVRGCYKELRRGVIALQSFIRGQNARRGYQHTSTSLRAIIIIQKQTRKYLQHQASLTHSQSGVRGSLDRRRSNQFKHEFGLMEDSKDQTRIPYGSLVDLQKRVVRTDARLRGKKEENIALKRKLFEMEKKWQQYEGRMKSMEKEWQDQLRYIQECLAAGKKNPANQIRFPNGTTVDITIHSDYNECEEGEVGEERVCLKLRPNEELRKLKLRFKAWKKEYKNKIRHAQSTFKKIGNTETATNTNQKNWWGRLSH
ncbi:hypothetical protein C2S53_013176 [Perilla frutescens var. hirtella]|uniref:Uncharacterized protein n=1 Tax=Perilla frutescens var. hirtella TaxID=608512 RepID=A0AAD4P6S8_PERFH|nr:hypothetical protein C2S53_013176 [Perilla frutescens var. hirtella]